MEEVVVGDAKRADQIPVRLDGMFYKSAPNSILVYTAMLWSWNNAMTLAPLRYSLDLVLETILDFLHKPFCIKSFVKH